MLTRHPAWTAGIRASFSDGACPVAVLSVVGTGLTLTSSALDLTDSEPRAQLWLGAAAGAVFLLAVPLVRGTEAHVLDIRARLMVGAGLAAVLAVFGLWQATQRAEPRILLLLVPALLLFVTAWIGVRESSRAREELRVGRLRARLDGQEIERRRWALELHDQTLQDLAAIELRLATRADLDGTRAMVRDQIRTLRHLITEMRPLALDTLGLAAALQDLASRAEATAGVIVHCDVSRLSPELAAETQLSVYRIVQEAVTNALKHAACHEVAITAVTEPGSSWVTVVDDGIGLDEPTDTPRSWGLGRAGMAERADAINGTLTWTRPGAGGTAVTLTLPDRTR